MVMRLAISLGLCLLLMGMLLLAPGKPASALAAQESRPPAESPESGDTEADESPGATPRTGPPQKIVEPFDLGLREEAGVTLLMLDVKVRDKKGRLAAR
ncbi:MAG: hypothetical protein E2P00_00185 [Acidobacteria bacterium]|nr:MAG: hypothetical protein E2P00_00185 [Acidobacteriota bacterium]